MESNTTKSKRIKMLLSLVIPMLVIVITIVMVSASFAWFSNVSIPTVQTIRLTAQKAFILTFTADETANERNINYTGQTAIYKNDGRFSEGPLLDGKLVTAYNGQKAGLAGSKMEQYILDAPYYFITTVALDTENTVIDMNMVLDTAKIKSGNTTLDTYDTIAGSKYAPTDVPYAFTWYFKEHVEIDGEAVKNFTGQVISEDDGRRVMADYKPSGGDVWYTPYGTLTFGANGLVSEVNGEAIANDASSGDSGNYSILDSGLRDISIVANSQKFDFYIVFAPEKLFWSQFFAEDRDKSVGDIYTAEEQKKIFGTSGQNQMYYSNTRYYGSTFEFGAMITVTTLHKTQGEQPAD